jgi:DNA mismatch repair protein MutL
MIAIDQHAAHERIGFERLKAQAASGRVERQDLLIPEQVTLSPISAAAVTEKADMLMGLGLEVEPFGGSAFMVKAVPAIMSGVNPVTLLAKIADELAELGASAAAEEVREHILKTMACHRQVRAGQTLSAAEMESLLAQMDSHPNTSYCPHGRPTFREFSKEEVERWFGR